jgi:hypothetical protein
MGLFHLCLAAHVRLTTTFFYTIVNITSMIQLPVFTGIRRKKLSLRLSTRRRLTTRLILPYHILSFYDSTPCFYRS